MAEVPELTKSATVERAAEEAPETIEMIDAESAIIIYRLHDGSVNLTSDINIPISVEKELTGDEVKALLHKILDDMTAQQIAFLAGNHAAAVIQMQAQKMREAMLNQGVLDQIGGSPKLVR